VALGGKDILNTEDPKDTAEKFLTEEFQRSWGYQQHIESQMVSHLRFYVTLLLGLGSVAIAIFKFGPASTFPIAGLVGLLFLGFWFAGQVLRTVYLELRIRKMKAIENLNSIREYFSGKSSVVSKVSAFPARRIESPPFLRKGSAEWYSLTFMALINSLSFAAFVYLVIHQWWYAGIQSWWLLFIILVIGLFYLEFRSFTLRCYKYDLKRSEEVGQENYDLLKLKDPSCIEKCLMKFGEYFERRYYKKLNDRKGK
jgi:uncharacterized membrane protein YciS (DUF1049 family)